MRRTFILLLLSLFLSVGTPQVFADRHDNGRPGHEQRDNRGNKRHDNHRHGKHDKHKPEKHDKHKPDKKHHNKGKKPGYGRPGMPPAHHPAPPRYGRPGGHFGHMPPPPMPPRLSPMVSRLTRGCHDVNVWQIDHDTYIVKYRKGRHHYTRRIYPYANRYDNPSLISVNWQPLSPWTLIPPIQLNINL